MNKLNSKHFNFGYPEDIIMRFLTLHTKFIYMNSAEICFKRIPTRM